MICPCKDCHERHEKCHSSCPEYKEWAADNENKRTQRHIENAKIRDANEFTKNSKKRRYDEYTRIKNIRRHDNDH